MEISPLQRKIQVSEIPVTKLEGNTSVSEKDKVAELSRQFEAVLIRQILSEGQKPQFGTDKTQSSSSSEIYRDMVTTQMADRISNSGGFGLANALKHQLSRQTVAAHPMKTSASSPTDTKGGN